jgi:hypothetical protein
VVSPVLLVELLRSDIYRPFEQWRSSDRHQTEIEDMMYMQTLTLQLFFF